MKPPSLTRKGPARSALMAFNSNLLPPAEGRPKPVLIGVGSDYSPQLQLGSFSLNIEGKPDLNTTQVISEDDAGSVLLKGILHVCDLIPKKDLTIFLGNLDVLDDLDDRNALKWRYHNSKGTERISQQYLALMRRIVGERSKRRVVFLADDSSRTEYATFLAEYELRKALIEQENA